MSDVVEALKSQLVALPARDRAELASFLLGTLDGGPEPTPEDVEAAWDAELDRRWVEIRSGKAIYTPAEQVFAELREKYKGTRP